MDGTRTVELVQPKESLQQALKWSIWTGVLTGVFAYLIVSYVFDFRYVGTVLGLASAFLGGWFAGTQMYYDPGRQVQVPLKSQGVPTFRDDPAESGRTYDTGTHWRPPLCGLLVVPGPDQTIPMDLPGEDINTQDGSIVLMGRHENISASKPNRVSIRIVDPFRYVRLQNFKQEFKQLFNGLARVFFGQMDNAYAVKNERTLFEEFLELPARCYRNPDHEAYRRFRRRLLGAAYSAQGAEGANKEWKSIFARDVAADGKTPVPDQSNAVDIIMSRAGEMAWMCERWGVEADFYPTNVRVDPRLEQASTDQTATRARMAAAKEQSDNIAKIIEEFTKRGVTANMAALLATDRVDPTSEVKLEHVTRDFPQFTPEAIAAAVAQVVAAIRAGRV